MSQGVAPGSTTALLSTPNGQPPMQYLGGSTVDDEAWAEHSLGGGSIDTASTGVLLNNLPAAFTLSAHLQSRLSQAPPVYALDGALVKDMLVTLADTCQSQARLIEDQRHRVHALERCIRAVARKDPDIKAIKDRLQDIRSDIDNLTHNLQGFVDPNTEKDDFYSKSHTDAEDDHNAEIEAIMAQEFKAMEVEKEALKAQMKDEAKQPGAPAPVTEMVAPLAALPRAAPLAAPVEPAPIEVAPQEIAASAPVAVQTPVAAEAEAKADGPTAEDTVPDASTPAPEISMDMTTAEASQAAVEPPESSATQESVASPPATESQPVPVTESPTPETEPPAAEAETIPEAAPKTDETEPGSSLGAEVQVAAAPETADPAPAEVPVPAQPAPAQPAPAAPAQVTTPPRATDESSVGSDEANGSEEAAETISPMKKSPKKFGAKKGKWGKLRSRSNSVMVTKAFSPAKTRWRKAIKSVIMMNRRNKGMMGMISSRVPKGQSLADRMNRLENHIFDLRKEIESSGVLDMTTSLKGDMQGIQSAHEEIMAMLQNAGIGQDDGILSKLVAMDAVSKLQELEELLAKGVGGGVDPEEVSATVQETIKGLMVSASRKSLDKALAAAKDLESDVNDAVASMAGKEAFPMEATARNLRDRLTLTDASIGAVLLDLIELAGRLNQDFDATLMNTTSDDPAADFEGDTDQGVFKNAIALFKRLQDFAEASRTKLNQFDEGINSKAAESTAAIAALQSTVTGMVPQLREFSKDMNNIREAQAAASERLHSVEMASASGPETDVEELVKDVVEQYITSLRNGMKDSSNAQAQKIDKCGQQIKDLFLTKADKRPVEDTLEVKADKELVEELDKELKAITSEISKNKGSAERMLAAFKKKLERKLLTALKSKEEDNDALGTSKCLLCQRPSEMKSKTLSLSDKPVYNPQTGRYFLPKIGTSKGSEEVLRGGFRMPLEGYPEAQEALKEQLMTKSLKDLQQTASTALLEHEQGLRPVASPDRSVPEVRPRGPEYKWTGNNQVMRDHPSELWRPVGADRPHTTSGAGRVGAIPRSGEPGKFDDLAAWGQSTGTAVGFDARMSRGKSSS